MTMLSVNSNRLHGSHVDAHDGVAHVNHTSLYPAPSHAAAGTGM